VTDVSHSGIHIVDRKTVDAYRCTDQDYRNRQSARSRKFAVSRLTAAVLGDYPVYAVRHEQRPLGDFIERTPRLDVLRVGQTQGRFDRVHCPNEIPMLGRPVQSRQPLTADGDENTPRSAAQCLDRSVRAFDFSPSIPRHRSPRSPAHGQNRRPCVAGSGRSVLGHVNGEGMSRIDEQADVFVSQIFLETLDAPKTAVTGGDGLLQRLTRTTRERQCHLEIPPVGKALRQLARLGGPTQNQNVRYVGR